ncbi:hypothetical protein BB560_002586 [Smittium megazygosporum]|uniref:Uncharacterized protein n=1 Tax=Smittium megazygosporum TaxID=133381 RepID=A0A2T9XWM6_9FUNG|nr:hypothetical protein BB560_007343 [Smittium megazygosporum]PVV02951.1 hypothetical protein BB560_002586 [Smittium megazygosporum]
MIASMWKSERIEVKKKYKAKSEELKNRINNHNRIAKESVSTNMYLKLQVDDNLEKNSKKVDSATQSLVENSTVLPSEPCINEWVQGLSSSNAPNQYNQPIDYSRLSGTNVQQPHSGNTCVVTEQAEILDDEDIKLKNFHKEQSSKHRRSISYPDNLVQGFGFGDNIYKSIFFDVEPRLEQQILKPELNSLTEDYSSNIYHQQTSHISGLDAPWTNSNYSKKVFKYFVFNETCF